jgi:hypothetical protein
MKTIIGSQRIVTNQPGETKIYGIAGSNTLSMPSGIIF